MSNLENKIKEDLKTAMRAKKETEVLVLRMLIGAMRNKEISQRDGQSAELNDEQVMEVINSELKKRRDSIESYLAGGRQDLAEKEQTEIAILAVYLPAQLSDEEIEKTIKESLVSSSFGANDFGLAMKQVMPALKGKADGKKISEILKKVLA